MKTESVNINISLPVQHAKPCNSATPSLLMLAYLPTAPLNTYANILAYNQQASRELNLGGTLAGGGNLSVSTFLSIVGKIILYGGTVAALLCMIVYGIALKDLRCWEYAMMAFTVGGVMILTTAPKPPSR